MANRTSRKNINPYITKDWSLIRELLNPSVHGKVIQSLAEAAVHVNRETLLHKHTRSSEIYYFIEGNGLPFLGSEHFDVSPGDTVYILPGTPHRIQNAGSTPLRLLCCCSPAYSHDDTELLP